MTPNPFIKQYLMTAGPTPLPPKVSQVMAEPALYHRDPAGVALCSVSERALEYAARRPGGRYYFDFASTAKNQRESPPNSPFTPPVTILAALDVALEMIAAE